MLLWADGFEHYGLDETNMLAGEWAAFVWTPQLSTAFARTGTHSLHMQGRGGAGVQSARRVFGAEKIGCSVGFGVYCPQLPASNSLFYFTFLSPAAADILTVAIQSDGSLCVRSGGIAGTVIDITDSVITAGTFHHIAMKALFDTVAGATEIQVNGVTKQLIGSLNLGSAGASSFRLNNNETTAGDGYYVDDMKAFDDQGTYNNDIVGPHRVLTNYVAADTAQADWSLNGAGTGTGCINQTAPDGDTTYIGTALAGDKSEFTMQTLPPELVEIAGIYIPAMARLDAAGIGNLQLSMVSGASDDPGPDTPLTTGYTYYGSVFEEDPDTTDPYTKAGFEAALLRIEKSL